MPTKLGFEDVPSMIGLKKMPNEVGLKRAPNRVRLYLCLQEGLDMGAKYDWALRDAKQVGI